MKKLQERKMPVEAILILEKLDADTLRGLVQISLSLSFESLLSLCRRYAETKRNQIIDLPTEDERKLANGVAIRKGSIFTAGVIIDVIKGAQKELQRRKKE